MCTIYSMPQAFFVRSRPGWAPKARVSQQVFSTGYWLQSQINKSLKIGTVLKSKKIFYSGRANQ